jgi:hypothetical protein
VVIYEETLTNANGNLVILDVYLIMKGYKKKENHHARGSERGEECQYYKKNPTSWEDKCFWNHKYHDKKLKKISKYL